jgi:hypothetical protein
VHATHTAGEAVAGLQMVRPSTSGNILGSFTYIIYIIIILL